MLAEMGLKLEDDAKKQTRPEEHQNGDGEPSVKEETQEATEPSVKEAAQEATEPSVKEETHEKNPPPSV